MPSPFDFPELPSQFRQLLGQCRDLYVSSGELAVREQAAYLGSSAESFVALMDDLHKALLVKVFVTMCECDREWAANEKFLAEVLVFHLWSEWLDGDKLQQAIETMSKKAATLQWYALVRPFDQIAPLRNRVAELETIVVRLANIVARADGPMQPVEAARIKSLQDELHVHLREIPIDEEPEHAEVDRAGAQAIEKIFTTADRLPAMDKPSNSLPSPSGRGQGEGARGTHSTAAQSPWVPDPSVAARRAPITPPAATTKPASAQAPASAPAAEKTPAEQLAEAMAELDRLIGLANIKEEVRTLANFLKVQTKRKDAGLPTTELSLHMVFDGNPGTGKTSVARIVGKIFGAMGVLKKGHLIETDRSGLVAEYAGQTGPKSHKKIDEAMDGVLFIDEAYTLISTEGEDPYGNEAVQTLLKRMEDDRERLVVILAGYPMEMQLLLESNPGLESRFSRQLEFLDYTPLELSEIFGQMSQKNQYKVAAPVRAKVVVGLTWMHSNRDRNFGNGRTVRNLFEDAIRRQANRIAEITDLTVEQLATLEPPDIEFKECPRDALAPLKNGKLKFEIVCPHCKHEKDMPEKYLGQGVKCPKCKKDFVAEWGEMADASPPADEAKEAAK